MVKTEKLISQVYSHTYNNVDEQLNIYDDWAKTYDSTVVGECAWTGASKAAGYVFLNYPWDVQIGDVGCGTGILGKILRTGNYSNIDGYDVSQKMMEYAKEYYKTTEFCNIAETPLPKRYDIITATGIFTKGHVDATAVPHLKNSLNPGGELVVTFPVLEDYNYEVEAGWTKQTDFKVIHRQIFGSYSSDSERLQHELIVYKLKEKH